MELQVQQVLTELKVLQVHQVHQELIQWFQVQQELQVQLV